MKKSFGVTVVALVAAMSFAGVALAEEVDDEAGSQILTPVVIVDEEAGTVTIAIPVDGQLPEGCLPEEDPDETATQDDEAAGGDNGDEEVTDDEEAVTYGPGDCIEFVIEHPSGKTHHGAIVSTVAKNLHPSMLNGIKKGEIMRWVAKTGKIDDGDDGDDGEVTETKADKEQRKADREARKAERKAERDAAKAERKAERDAAKAERKAAQAANKANRGKKNG